MNSTLIIAEKADAARRIAYFLSDGKSKQKREKGLSYIEFEENGHKTYLVALSGHIVEINFPPEMKNWSSVDLNTLIDSKIIQDVKNKGSYNSLTKLAAESSSFIVATDYDREGELIGAEALALLPEKYISGKMIKRAKFSALTGEEIKSAFDQLIDVDYALADSAGAREEIDLIWGAVLTRFFSLASKRLGKSFLSIGRVQTPTLALIVKREKEIRAFQPVPFWRIKVLFDKDGQFTGIHEKGDIFDQSEAERIFKVINGKDGTVLEYEKKQEKIYKPAPFNTTEFLREASRIGVNPSRAMNIAERLYTQGLISYPRTDNTVYHKSINFKSILAKLKDTHLSKEVNMVLSQEKIRPSRGRMETTDHPPIYPVNAPQKGKLTGDFQKIYDLVARRFLATLYKEGERDVSTSRIDISGEVFNTKGIRITDPGWLEIYPYTRVQESFHPPLAVGEKVKAEKWDMEEDQTKPPWRYDLASLIKEMEKLNLGTKSTRHDIIDKLQKRGFIEGNPVRPTNLGMGLIESVLTVDSKISEPDMTAELEVEMDGIAEKKMSKGEVVNRSRKMLHGVLDAFKDREELINTTIKRSINMGEVIGKCPEHKDSDIVLIKDRMSIRITCTMEDCRNDFRLSINGLIQPTEKACPECGLPQIKVIRRGQSPETRCIDPKCSFNTERDNMGKCPSDSGNLVVRQSRYGKRFLGCSNYPDCTVTYPLPQMGVIKFTGDVCPYCSSPILVSMRNRRVWKFCPKMDCQFNKKKDKVAGSEKKPA